MAPKEFPANHNNCTDTFTMFFVPLCSAWMIVLLLGAYYDCNAVCLI